ncbi:MAG TPA: SPASM domain-containing protein [Myxococcota bacterium]|nr:SPASM domain-containing protein [Myxococcota bacterium]
MASETNLTLLVKPVGADCPLACSYCFYRDRAEVSSSPRRMSERTLELLVSEALGAGVEQVDFIWQGGEPLLAGLDFYQRAARLQRDGKGPRITNSFQTSGIGLDEGWAEFFASEGWLVGLSIDGDAEQHDAERPTRGGRPTHALALKAARLLLDAGVEVNAMSVVSRYNHTLAAERYDNLVALGFSYIQFIPAADADPDDPTAVAPWSIDGEQWGRFLCALWNRWQADMRRGKLVVIRDFDSILATYLGHPAGDCTRRQSCGDYLVVDHDGALYSCDFFVDQPLGQLGEQGLTEVLEGPRQRAFGMAKAARHADCDDCQWLQRCWGDCPRQRVGPGVLCEGTRRFLAHADGGFKALAKRLRPGPPPRRNAPCPCGSGERAKRCCY